MDLAADDLQNVASGKEAWQSSTSKWSKPHEAKRALADDGERDFAFHTGLEDKPWWRVDLGEIYPIHSIVVGNRRKMNQEQARTLKVEISRDGETWTAIHSGFLVWSGDLVLPLGGAALARHLRLSLQEKAYLHLSKVEVWAKRPKIKVAANRPDGFGLRMQCLLNGLYLAKALNCEFKLVWPDGIAGPAKDFEKSKEKDASNLIGHSVEPLASIFADERILGAQSAGRLAIRSLIAEETGLSAAQLLQSKLHDEPNTLYAPSGDLGETLAPELAPNAEFGLPDIFESLKFSPSMEKAIQAARAVDLERNFAALHIRSGDIVYGPYRLQGTRFAGKAVSMPLARMAIENLQGRGLDVLVFGEDGASIAELARAYNVRPAAAYLKDLNYVGPERSIFEIVLMSRTSEIWAASSGFSRLAHSISRSAQDVNIHKAFSSAKKIAFFTKDLAENAGVYHPMQAAYAYWQLYVAHLAHKSPSAEKIAALEAAKRHDPENVMYDIALASELYAAKRHEAAEGILERALLQDFSPEGVWDSTFGLTVLLSGPQKKPYLSNLAAKIQQSAAPPYNYALLAAALIAYRKKEFAKAAALLKDCVIANKNPADPRIQRIAEQIGDKLSA